MIRVPCFTDLKICACMHAPGHEAFDKKMSDVFEACWVMGKYLQGVKEAEEEMEQGREGGEGVQREGLPHFCTSLVLCMH